MADVVLENLTKTFKKRIVVNKLSLEVKDKEFICFLGPTGCGKTTIFRMIAGVETPDEGTIYLDGSAMNDVPPGERNVAMVFQSFALFPNMTVFDNLAFPLKVKKTPRDEIKKKVSEAADVLRITHLLDKIPAHLSGGERQRVALGEALVRNPKVCLLDEPLTNLDAKLRAEMRVELKRLQRELGYTMIYSTPDQIEAMAMADRIAVMNFGRLEQFGTSDDVYSRPKSLFVAGFIGSPAMNFIDCTFAEKDKQAFLDTGVFTLDVTDLRETISKSNGSEMILGFRPEDVIISKTKPDKNAYTAKIEVIEHLKPDKVIDLDVGGPVIKALTPSAFEATVGEKVWFTFSKFHIINKKTKETIV